MRWPSVMALSALVVTVSGCENVRNKIPFLSKKQAAPAVGQPAQPLPAPGVTTAAVDTSRPAPPPPAETPRAVAELIDEPWTPVDTGTVDPGMTRDQVIAIWVIPVAERTLDPVNPISWWQTARRIVADRPDVVLLQWWTPFWLPQLLVLALAARHGAGLTICPRDVEGQTVYIFDKIAASLEALGASLSDVVRTRIYMRDATQWESVASVHARLFGAVRPVNTLLQIGALVGDCEVEIEAEAEIGA